MKLWIDDVRLPPTGWFWAKNSEVALQLLSTDQFDEISFDHDLGGDDTAYPVATWIEEQAYHGKINKMIWYVHSANPIGRERIKRAMQAADKYWNRE